MTFQTKTLHTEMRSCLRLKEMREQQNISLEDLSKKLKMSKSHILAIEECRVNDLPFATIYRKKLVADYCKILGIDDLIDQFIEEELEPTLLEKKQTQIKKRTAQWYNIPLFLRAGCILTMVLLFFGYLGLQVKKIVEPPTLNLISPINGFITKDSNLQIAGQTDKEVTIMINGKEIKNNTEGAFDEKLTLSPGVNTLVVSAQKKHGKTTTETRHVVLEQTTEFSLTNNATANN